MPDIIFTNDADFAPTFSVSGDISVRTYRVVSPTLDGTASFSGTLTVTIPRPKPLVPMAGQFAVQGTLTAAVKEPPGAFKDFAHYPYSGIDPAMAMIGVTSGGLTSAASGSYSRQYAAFTGPADYPASAGAYAWKKAAYVAAGFKFASMSANKHQILDAVQMETLALGKTAPSAYQTARSLNVIVKPTRLNYALNPNMESGLTGYGNTGSAALTLDTFRWQGTQSLMATVPAGAASDSGAALIVSGLVPGQKYTLSAKVAVAQSCGDIAARSGASATQHTAKTWQQAAETADPANPRWRTISVTFTPSLPTVDLRVQCTATTMTPGVASIFWVDGVLVEEGATARPYFDGSMGNDYLWEAGGAPNHARSYYYQDRVQRSFLVRTLLDENTPLGIVSAEPKYAVLPNQGNALLLTAELTASPNRVIVSDSAGVLATLTVGSKTVTVRGPSRTFTEQKRPFSDAFTRTVSNGLGQSPGGGSWLNLAGTDSKFSVNGSQGLVLLDVTNTARYASLNDGNLGDVSAAAALTFDKLPTGASCSGSITFGYQDSNNHYRARLLINTTGTVQLALESVAGGTATTLGAATTVGSAFVANQLWRVRAERTGNTIRCRAWQDGTTEPSTWTFSVSDTTYMAGRVGVRAIAMTGNTTIPMNLIMEEFAVTSGTWVSPPVITHNTWVRTLDTPFDGSWTRSLVTEILRWSTDTTPDALANAMKFITGAPEGIAPDGWRTGQSDYGPLYSDGTRIESSDWNDYLGFGWTYPNGETRTFPHGNITVSGGMDCSGFVRAVYGRLMYLPMSYSNSFDGLNIPRKTVDMGPNGPGIIVAQGTSTAPALTSLQIGDVVFFDADSSEPVEGQIDHCGIYLGQDTSGNYRFISSRKTANGPTFSDLGGNSTLNGTGTYATRFRKIRRF